MFIKELKDQEYKIKSNLFQETYIYINTLILTLILMMLILLIILTHSHKFKDFYVDVPRIQSSCNL